MNSLFKEPTLEKISKTKKGFLWTAVCLLIGGFLLGAIAILVRQSVDDATMIIIMKALSTVAVLTFVLFVGVNNCIRMEKGDNIIQILALVGLLTGILAAVLGILIIWEVAPAMESITRSCQSQERPYCIGMVVEYMPSVWMKVLSILTSLAGAGFWISNVMSIKETIKVVKPLKIASVICETYVAIYAIASVLSDYEIETNMPTLTTLTGLLAFAFVVMAIVAWIISRTTGKKQVANAPTNAPVAPKTNEELRAEIEEKVRREMIEKEVRAKMEAEQSTVLTTDSTAEQSTTATTTDPTDTPSDDPSE